MPTARLLTALFALLAAWSSGWGTEVPGIKPPGGAYDHPVTVVMKTKAKHLEIRYTIDGSIVTDHSSLYKHPIKLATTTTVRAQSFSGDVSGPEISVTYVITGVANVGATPTFTPIPGTYSVPQSVAIASTTPRTTIHYSIDGSEPTEASPVYSAPIAIAGDTTVRARGFAPGFHDGAIAVGAYVIAAPVVNTAPSFTKGPDQTTLEDSGACSITAWATGISAGPASDAGQTVS
ncbi:MAG: chitobiase/beta-hexosaminidase C-terminal domain-containing protein, partial [Planctomycetes bacterium]|nr:chitobiase/beta-hexosaminidase C-terminal domain-containing protein [Planctomycetota bacterium]